MKSVKCNICQVDDNYLVCSKCLGSYISQNEVKTKSKPLISKLEAEINATLDKFEQNEKNQIERLCRLEYLRSMIVQRRKRLKEKSEMITKLKKEIGIKRKQMNLLFNETTIEEMKNQTVKISSAIPKYDFIMQELNEFKAIKKELIMKLLYCLIEFTEIDLNFDSSKYFEFDEYINLIDGKHTVKKKENHSAQSKEILVVEEMKAFLGVENRFSKQGFDFNFIEENVMESMQIKSNLGSEFYQYIYKLIFIIKKLAWFNRILLPFPMSENLLRVSGINSRKTYSLHNHHLSMGFILLHQNLKFLKSQLCSTSESEGLEFRNFLNVKILVEDENRIRKEKNLMNLKKLSSSISLLEYCSFTIKENHFTK